MIGKNNSQMQFKILSQPTLLSTLWCWIPCSYFIFVDIYWPPVECVADDRVSSNELSANLSQAFNNSSDMNIDTYIYYTASVAPEFLMILLLPSAIGYFFDITESKVQKKFAWSPKGWIIGFSTVIFVLTEMSSLGMFAISDKVNCMSTWGIVHKFASILLMNGLACLLQLTVLLLVSSRQAYFTTKAAKKSKTTACLQINNLLKEYENIKYGTAPLYALEFCIHTPIILCFAYFAISTPQILPFLYSSGKIFWSSLTLIHICLMSEDCYNALQDLVPVIRYALILYSMILYEEKKL
jgi:hypothetical protein